MTKNSYLEIFKKLNITEKGFYQACNDEIIWPKGEKVEELWKNHLVRINNHESVVIRSVGRLGSKSEILQKFIKKVFNINIKFDQTNNAEPTKIIEETTGLTKCSNSVKGDLANYQVAHVFEERTSNPYLFSAPWMTCYVPRIIDPFTGHEYVGDKTFYTQYFMPIVFKRWGDYIKEYNEIIKKKTSDKFSQEIDAIEDARLKRNIIVTFSPLYEEIEVHPFKKDICRMLYEAKWWKMDPSKFANCKSYILGLFNRFDVNKLSKFPYDDIQILKSYYTEGCKKGYLRDEILVCSNGKQKIILTQDNICIKKNFDSVVEIPDHDYICGKKDGKEYYVTPGKELVEYAQDPPADAVRFINR